MNGKERIAQKVAGRRFCFADGQGADRNGSPAARIRVQRIAADPVAFVQPELTQRVGPELPDCGGIAAGFVRVIVSDLIFGSFQGAGSLRIL